MPLETVKSVSATPTIGSENVVVTVNSVFNGPAGADMDTVGIIVSIGTLTCAAALLPLPAAFCAAFAGKLINTGTVDVALGVILKV